MKIIVHLTLLLSILLTSTDGFAQQTKVGDLPESVTWNLHKNVQEEFDLKDCGLAVAQTDSMVWKKPSPLSVKIVYKKPSDYGFHEGFRSAEFIAMVLKQDSLAVCPEWLPVQMYMNLDYTGEAVWIPTERTKNRGEIARLGLNRRTHSKAFTSSVRKMDVFLDDPRSAKAGSVWVFITR